MSEEILTKEHYPNVNPFRRLPKYTPSQRAPEAAFKLQSTFFEAVLDRLQEVRKKENEQRRRGSKWGRIDPNYEAFGPETLPDLKQLETLVEKAFWASLEREEDRALKFTINYCKSSTSSNGVTFREPKAYEVRDLTKLAPAVGNRTLGIAVRPDHTGELEIWGLNVSPGLQIKVIDPGKLLVKFFVSNVAAISGDQSVPLRYPDLPFVASLFWKKFAPQEEGSDYTPWLDQRVHVISNLVRTMRELGHGGALVMVPNDIKAEDVEKLGGYQCDQPSSALAEAVELVNETRTNPSAKPDEVNAFEGWLDSLGGAVAALSGVDGATLLTYDMRILAFGVKFEFDSGRSLRTPVELQDPLDHDDYRKQITLDKAGGTRHQSAAQFVLKNHDAIAFVASQDGTVTAFVWEEWGDQKQYGSLVGYSRLELTMF